MLRAKGEELYTLIDDFERDYRDTVYKSAEHFLSGPTLQNANVFAFNNSNTKLQRVDMLTHVYFPSAISALETLKSCRTATNKITLAPWPSIGTTEAKQLAEELITIGDHLQISAVNLRRTILSSLSKLHGDLWE